MGLTIDFPQVLGSAASLSVEIGHFDVALDIEVIKVTVGFSQDLPFFELSMR